MTFIKKIIHHFTSKITKYSYEKRRKVFPTYNNNFLSENRYAKFFSSSWIASISLITMVVLELSLIIYDDLGIVNFLKKHTLVDESFNQISYYKLFLIAFIIFQCAIAVPFYISKGLINKNRKKFFVLSIEKNIDILLAMLAKILKIENQARFTVFISDFLNESRMKILYRKHLGRDNAKYRDDLLFSDTEGLPGKAKAAPMIIGKSEEDKRSFFDKVLIHHLSPDLPVVRDQNKVPAEVDSNYQKYFERQFNISKEKFYKLSDKKYVIQSYLSIGFMSNNYDKVVVLSIDSIKENAFYDLELFKGLFQDGVLAKFTLQRMLEHPDASKEVQEMSFDNALRANEICYHLVQVINLLHSVIYPGYSDAKGRKYDTRS